MKRTVNVPPEQACEDVAAYAEDGHIDALRGDRLHTISVEYAHDLILTGKRVAYTCGPLDHDLCVIDASTIYFFNVPHPAIR